MGPLLERTARVLATFCLLTLAVTAVVFLAFSFVHRPYNAVEAELTFEATRAAKGFALYVDPVRGAWEYGEPPSRFSVLYTPFWPYLVGYLAKVRPVTDTVRIVGRAVSILAWLVAYIAPVLVAPRGKRTAPAVASVLGASLFFLIRNAPSGTPDTLSAALASVALARAAKRDRVDTVSAVLFTAAPFMKPSCLGIFAGAFLVCVVQRKLGYKRALAAGAAMFIGLAGICHVLSGGLWIRDLVLSTGQEISFSRWVSEFGSRSFVLGLPHVIIAVLAWRQKVRWTVLGPLLTSIAWSTFSMAKLGSGSHYWYEPTLASIVAISAMANAEPLRPALAAWVRVGVLAMSITVAAITVPGELEQMHAYGHYEGTIARLKERCISGANDVAVSVDPVIEFSVSGRMIVPEWQTSFLVRHGLFPIESWRNDVRHPNVRCVVLPDDIEHPSVNPFDLGRSNVYATELRDVVRENFAFDGIVDGLFVHRRR
ncbi:hypothetical protein [Pendulispora albinea]|uniref:Mannosyltransferase n=1 Tax=Pendulispora albinea TaxID=2741071 RepID=A0ABZ2LUM8_9BACT